LRNTHFSIITNLRVHFALKPSKLTHETSGLLYRNIDLNNRNMTFSPNRAAL